MHKHFEDDGAKTARLTYHCALLHAAAASTAFQISFRSVIPAKAATAKTTPPKFPASELFQKPPVATLVAAPRSSNRRQPASASSETVNYEQRRLSAIRLTNPNPAQSGSTLS